MPQYSTAWPLSNPTAATANTKYHDNDDDWSLNLNLNNQQTPIVV